MYKFDHRLYPQDHDLNKLEHTLSEDASIQAFQVNWFQIIVHPLLPKMVSCQVFFKLTQLFWRRSRK